MQLRWSMVIALVLFIVVAPFTVDTYNTLNQRAFMSLFLKGNPFSDAMQDTLEFRGETWQLDWPYPPLTILLDLPAWLMYRQLAHESLYQFLFKLPLFGSAVVTFFLLEKVQQDSTQIPPRVLWADWFILNPALILLTTVAGGFEIVMTMFLVWAFYLLYKSHLGWSGLMLGLAVALRLYPIVLAPVFCIELVKRPQAGWSAVIKFLVVVALPSILTIFPFLVLDARSLFDTIALRQLALGPFATINGLVPLIYAGLALVLPAAPIYASVFTLAASVSFILMAIGLCSVYLFSCHYQPRLGEMILLALLVFFAFYPKVHGLYTIAIFPFALVTGTRISAWVWLPGAIWMLLVNGAFGASGLLYFLAPSTGLWIPSVSPMLFAQGTILLILLQLCLIILSIIEMVKKITARSRQRQLLSVRRCVELE